MGVERIARRAHGKLLGGLLVWCVVSRWTETKRSREGLDCENPGLCVISSETGIWGGPGLHAEKGCTADASVLVVLLVLASSREAGPAVRCARRGRIELI